MTMYNTALQTFDTNMRCLFTVWALEGIESAQ